MQNGTRTVAVERHHFGLLGQGQAIAANTRTPIQNRGKSGIAPGPVLGHRPTGCLFEGFTHKQHGIGLGKAANGTLSQEGIFPSSSSADRVECTP